MNSVNIGAFLISQERRRQINQEGYTDELDDAHIYGDIGLAAVVYAHAASQQAIGKNADDIRSFYLPPSDRECGQVEWPWGESYLKPSNDPIRNLVKAGALIAAEIDRLQRKCVLNGHD